jgi:hypothetical protein
LVTVNAEFQAKSLAGCQSTATAPRCKRIGNVATAIGQDHPDRQENIPRHDLTAIVGDTRWTYPHRLQAIKNWCAA